jgi:hypothetical protein
MDPAMLAAWFARRLGIYILVAALGAGAFMFVAGFWAARF